VCYRSVLRRWIVEPLSVCHSQKLSRFMSVLLSPVQEPSHSRKRSTDIARRQVIRPHRSQECDESSGRFHGACYLWRVTDRRRLSHVPLTLLYSSTTKLFLLAMLSIWRSSPTHGAAPARPLLAGDNSWNSWLTTFWTALDDGTLDREWLVRNMLGGMAAGFGLRSESCLLCIVEIGHC